MVLCYYRAELLSWVYVVRPAGRKTRFLRYTVMRINAKFWGKELPAYPSPDHFFVFQYCAFLALLDYFSRGLEIKICPSSVCRLSVRLAIISESSAPISFKFWLLLPLGDTLRHLLFFFYECVSFSLTWDPMGAKIQNATPYV